MGGYLVGFFLCFPLYSILLIYTIAYFSSVKLGRTIKIGGMDEINGLGIAGWLTELTAP